MTIDWVRVSQGILRLVIDLIVGGVGAYLVYLFTIKRTEIERQEKLREHLREELLRGVHNPEESIELLEAMRSKLDIIQIGVYTTTAEQEAIHARNELVGSLSKTIELMGRYSEKLDEARAEYERFKEITGGSER